jgi:ribonuclease HI
MYVHCFRRTCPSRGHGSDSTITASGEIDIAASTSSFNNIAASKILAVSLEMISANKPKNGFANSSLAASENKIDFDSTNSNNSDGGYDNYDDNSDGDNFVVYTDGSCLGNYNVKTQVNKAGFGLAVLVKTRVQPTQIDSSSSSPLGMSGSGSSSGKLNNDKAESLTLLCQINGPVVTDRNHEDFMGAEKGSNNTAELSAIGYFFKWFLKGRSRSSSLTSSSTGSQALISRSDKSTIDIRFDSEYAAKSITGEYNGKENRQLIENIRKLYDESSKSLQKGKKGISFNYVKSHSGDHWNDAADKLAKEGCLLSTVQIKNSNYFTLGQSSSNGSTSNGCFGSTNSYDQKSKAISRRQFSSIVSIPARFNAPMHILVAASPPKVPHFHSSTSTFIRSMLGLIKRIR